MPFASSFETKSFIHDYIISRNRNQIDKRALPLWGSWPKSTKERCLVPAAYGCRTCRLHGARRRNSIKQVTAHPNFLHGAETLEAKQQRSLKLAELREIELDLFSKGLIVGSRTAGRKPTGG
jgi:hypothetical protein